VLAAVNKGEKVKTIYRFELDNHAFRVEACVYPFSLGPEVEFNFRWRWDGMNRRIEHHGEFYEASPLHVFSRVYK
jgi:hypothetical protein